MEGRGEERERERFCVWQLVDIGRRPAARREEVVEDDPGDRSSPGPVVLMPSRSTPAAPSNFCSSNHISRSDSRERTDNRYPLPCAINKSRDFVKSAGTSFSLFAVSCKLSKEALARFAGQDTLFILQIIDSTTFYYWDLIS